MNTLKNKINSIEKFLKEKLQTKKAIIGISGGIDSAVVAYLCQKSLPLENIVTVYLPYFDKDIEQSFKTRNKLNIKSSYNFIHPIKNIVDTYPFNNDFVKGNVMARVRMTILYAYANLYNGLVVGTTNKSEFKIGYFTKYGDGGVDIEPIIDLYKTEVWEVAKILGVPQEFIDKIPTAGLWNDQTDENEIGITYQELDDILKAFEIKNIYTRKIIIGQYKHNKMNKVKNLIQQSEHKRKLPAYN